jgi:CCR4-NOT transcription complex subunit 3
VDATAKYEAPSPITNGTTAPLAAASPAISTAAPAILPVVPTPAVSTTAPIASPTTATQTAFPATASPAQPSGNEAQDPVQQPEPQTQQAPAQQTPSSQTPGGQQRIAGSLADLVSSFESVKQKAAIRMADLDSVHKLLEGGHGGAPQPLDTEKAKYYVPKNPWQTPSYYPQQPHPLLSRPEIFSQLEVETLFWIFYYSPGTYQQYLAARELKKQSWRFHVKYLTWFQRHSEPQAITDEYEQGVYVYFDWEGSWCQRRKNDFRFEYRYLSED